MFVLLLPLFLVLFCFFFVSLSFLLQLPSVLTSCLLLFLLVLLWGFGFFASSRSVCFFFDYWCEVVLFFDAYISIYFYDIYSLVIFMVNVYISFHYLHYSYLFLIDRPLRQ